MSDPTKPRKHTRVTLTKAQLSSESGQQLVDLCLSLGLDGEFSDSDLRKLAEFTSNCGDDIFGVVHLRGVLADALADGEISDSERLFLRRQIERILPADERERLAAAQSEAVQSSPVEEVTPPALAPSRSWPNAYFLKREDSFWGPIKWDKLRYWLGMKWLPEDTLLYTTNSAEEVPTPASQIPELWTIAGRRYEAKDNSSGTMSGNMPISKALQRYLTEELGWPGSTAGFNYYNGDKLRRDLEKIFCDPHRPLLDDPDWPWSGECPAAAARTEAARQAEPITENQKRVLRFFGCSLDGITKGGAERLIGELLAVPKKAAAWENAKRQAWSLEPATDRQLFRLRFAARSLNRTLPEVLTKQAASDLIDQWFASSPALEDAYQQHKIDEEEREHEQWQAEIRQSVNSEEQEWQKSKKAVSQPSPTKSVQPPSAGRGCLLLLAPLLMLGIAAVAKWFC